MGGGAVEQASCSSGCAAELDEFKWLLVCIHDPFNLCRRIELLVVRGSERYLFYGWQDLDYHVSMQCGIRWLDEKMLTFVILDVSGKRSSSKPIRPQSMIYFDESLFKSRPEVTKTRPKEILGLLSR